jgi:hypothetical protein
MSGYVDSVISELGMVENMGLAAGTASPTLSVQESFPLPGYIVRHFEFRWSHVSRWAVVVRSQADQQQSRTEITILKLSSSRS